MVLRLCPWRSHNLLPTFGTFHELENSLRMPINGLGNLMGSPGGPRKPTWRWNLKFFFHGINFYYKRGYYCEKRGWKSSKTKKFFFAQIPHAFIQCNDRSWICSSKFTSKVAVVNQIKDSLEAKYLPCYQPCYSV